MPLLKALSLKSFLGLLRFDDSLEDLQLHDLELVDLDDLDLLSFFCSYVTSFSQLWILCLKEKIL